MIIAAPSTNQAQATTTRLLIRSPMGDESTDDPRSPASVAPGQAPIGVSTKTWICRSVLV